MLDWDEAEGYLDMIPSLRRASALMPNDTDLLWAARQLRCLATWQRISKVGRIPLEGNDKRKEHPGPMGKAEVLKTSLICHISKQKEDCV
jgi:hypothetical protein